MKEPPVEERLPTSVEAALRRVAILVARESSPGEIFVAVSEEAGRVLESEAVGLLRFENDDTATLVAQSDTPWDPPPLGTRFALDGDNVVVQVYRTRKAARVDDWTGSTGAVSAMASVLGVRSVVAGPIVVEGRLWGTIVAATSRDEPLPPDTEFRLEQFTDLVATAIATAEARARLSQLAEEQEALRRVAVLVAQQPSPEEVFTAVTEAVGPLLGADLAAMLVFRGEAAVVIGGWQLNPVLPMATRMALHGDSAVARIFRTGKAARFDAYPDAPGEVAEAARELGLRSSVGAPILVQGKLWGALLAATRGEEPMPRDAEARIAAFTQLVATAVSNAEARENLQRVADEQAALRRVATLVAQQPSPEEIFAAVVEAVGSLLTADYSAMVAFVDDVAGRVVGSWSRGERSLPVGTPLPLDSDSAVARVFHSGAAARVDGYAEGEAARIADALGVRSTVGAPILVEGKLWGALAAAVGEEAALPEDAEARIVAFTELVATAISNAQARRDVQRLAEEQAALRRVATLVAVEASRDEIFAAIADGVAGALREELRLMRFDGDDSVVLAASGGPHGATFPVGTRAPVSGNNALSHVLRTGEPIRIDDYSAASGPLADAVRAGGLTGTVATPVVVEGRTWGAMVLGAFGEAPLPGGIESRLGQFAELMATSIANTEARAEIQRLAEQEAALRRIATLVAGGAAPEQVFAAVTDEIAATFDAITAIMRFAHDPPGKVMVGLSEKEGIPIGTRWPLSEGMLSTEVYRTGRSTRFGAAEASPPVPLPVAGFRFGIPSQVACPIVVEGSLWGVITLNAERELPPDTEQRLEKFTELVTTAIANAEARADLRATAEQQGALRRVAMLVAASAPPSDVFAAVTAEIALVLGADASLLCRADTDGAAVVVGAWGQGTPELGTRLARGGTNLTTIVLDTGRSARIGSYDDATGGAADVARLHGLRSAVGAPIVVEGVLWGLVIAGMTSHHSLAPDAEARLVGFTELVATAVANASARSELVASRARIVAAGDEARRRIERDLHDGTQQRLIALGLDLQRARTAMSEDTSDACSILAAVEEDLDSVLADLRELSHGLHPPLLARAGLRPSLRSLAHRSPIPVALDIDLPARPSPSVEIAVYYAVSEALTNAIKHSRASSVSVTVTADDAGGLFALDLLGHRAAARVYATIVDDGVGGAAAGSGSGLIGLADRVDALGGRLGVDSPVGAGTRISVELPLELPLELPALG